MAISRIAFGTNSASAPSSMTVTPSATAQQNDLVLICVSMEASSSNNHATASISGFTQVGSDADLQYARSAVFKKIAGGSEPSSYTINFSGGSLGTAIAGVVVYRGVDTTDSTPTVNVNQVSTATVTPTFSATTHAYSNSVDFLFAASGGESQGASSFVSWSGSVSNIAYTASGYGKLGMGDATRSSSGSQGTETLTITGNNEKWNCHRIEIRENVGGGATASTKMAFYRMLRAA